MSIGYACLALGVSGTELKSCTLKNASPERLTALIAHNLHSLENILRYNHENHISLFRISSDLIPFGSSVVNQLPWWTMFQDTFQEIGKLIQTCRIRVSMHPGQYTVLNSPDKEVVKRAIQDLEYHARVLDCLQTGPECKIILHIGGIYGDKKQAISNFISYYRQLSSSVCRRLVIENDDRSFSIDDVLDTGMNTGIPVVFDLLHHAVNHTSAPLHDLDWIQACKRTWKPEDGTQKIHYSQQDTKKKPGAHSGTIKVKEFLDFYHAVENVDIMLEVKDKNLSAVKCILCTDSKTNIHILEKEWSKYKYLVLEASPAIYNQVRSLLQDKASHHAVTFYTLLENALQMERSPGNMVNAAEHVWGYFSEVADKKEKAGIEKLIHQLPTDVKKRSAIRSALWKMVQKYQLSYLFSSYYFLDI